MAAAASLRIAAEDCDLDAMPDIDGTNRFNPFMKAIACTPEKHSSTWPSGIRDRKGRVEGPKLAWDPDQIEGPMAAKDKATFT